MNSYTLQPMVQSRIAKLFMAVTFVAATFIAAIPSASAAVPTTLNYQGRLKNSSGNAISSGTYDFQFRFYTNSSTCASDTAGASMDGTILGADATVTNGYFSTSLDLNSVDTSGDDAFLQTFARNAMYMQIGVKPDASSSYEVFSSCVTLNIAPFALISRSIENLTTEPTADSFTGRTYYNTTSGELYVYTGSAYEALTVTTLDELYDKSVTASALTVTVDNGLTYTVNGSAALTFTASGDDNIVYNLSSTADMVIQDNGTAFATFTDTGSLNITPSTNVSGIALTGTNVTTGTLASISSTALTTGMALSVAATNTAVANSALDQVNFTLINNQATLANTDITGIEISFKNDPTVAGNTERIMRLTNATTTNATDNAVAAMLILDNADTSATGSTVITDAISITNSGAIAAGIVDAIDASDSTITNALNVGDNTITGTDGVIDFTDFDVVAEGFMTMAPDSAGDSITITPAAGASQALVLVATAAMTDTSGIVDLDVNAADAAVDALNIALTQNDGATAAVDATAAEILLTGNDADGDMFGLTITSAASTNAAAGTYEALLKLSNAENTAGAVTDGILVTTSSGTAGDITDAIDVSAGDITNAINVGANTITGTDALIDFTDFDVIAEGFITTAPDSAGDSFTTTLTAGDSQALVLVATAAMTSTTGIIDLDVNAGDAAVVAEDIALTQNDGATAARDAIAANYTLTANDADGDMFGLVITSAATTNAAAGSYEALLKLSNAENTAGAVTDGILVTTSSGTPGDITDAIDVSAGDITNALNIGANTITGTDGVIDFTDFDVVAEGFMTMAPDSAGDSITITPAAGASQALVLVATGAMTDTSGIVDLDVNAADAAVDALNIALTQNDGATAAVDATAAEILLTANDADGDVFGLTITSAATTNAAAGSYEALLRLSNAENTAGAVTDGILVTTSSGSAGDITDAIDVSAGDITNAINVGANTITGTDAVIDFTDFDVIAEGFMTSAPDSAGDSFTTTLAAGASQALVLVATAAMTDTSGIVDLDVNAADAAVDALNIALTQNDGATAAVDATAMEILLTGNDADGDMFGLTITSAATANATTGTYEALLKLSNAEGSASVVTDAILVDSTSGTGGDIIDALDASNSTINNAIRTGANFILMDSSRMFEGAAGTVTMEDDSGNDYLTIVDNGTNGTLTVSGDVGVTGGDLTSGATTFNLLNATVTTLNFAGAATELNIADAAVTGIIDIGGVTANGVTTVKIATEATSADTIEIGNSHTDSTVKVTGGDDWSITTAGVATFELAVATGANGPFAICHETNGAQTEALKDCNGAPTADYAEQYPVEVGITYGDIVVPGAEEVITTQDHHIVKLVKSDEPYQSPVVGIVSDNTSDFTSAGYNIAAEDNPMPVALVGRVPVNVTNEGGPISVGNFITTSSTAGYGMKATEAGRVIGMALSPFNGERGQVMVQVINTWYQPDAVATPLQGGPSESLSETSEDTEVVVTDVTYEGTVAVQGALEVGRNSAGRVRIVQGDIHAVVNFEEKYETQPIINVSPRDAAAARSIWWVAEETTQGFEITLAEYASEDIEFNWFAVGVQEGLVTISDGTTEDIVVEVREETEEVVSSPSAPSASSSSSDVIVSEDADTSESVDAESTEVDAEAVEVVSEVSADAESVSSEAVASDAPASESASESVSSESAPASSDSSSSEASAPASSESSSSSEAAAPASSDSSSSSSEASI